MAILNLTIDTKTYECTATVNDTPITNVDSISVYNFGEVDRPRYTFSLNTFDRVGDVRVSTTVSASKTTGSVTSELADDLFEVKPTTPSEVKAALTNWFSKGGE